MNKEEFIKRARNYVDDKVVTIASTSHGTDFVMFVSHNGLTTYALVGDNFYETFGENLQKASEEFAFLIRMTAKTTYCYC